MDTGTGRSVGIRLSVLWYRVIVQRKHWVVVSYCNLESRRSCRGFAKVAMSLHVSSLSRDSTVQSSHLFLGHHVICFLSVIKASNILLDLQESFSLSQILQMMTSQELYLIRIYTKLRIQSDDISEEVLTSLQRLIWQCDACSPDSSSPCWGLSRLNLMQFY